MGARLSDLTTSLHPGKVRRQGGRASARRQRVPPRLGNRGYLGFAPAAVAARHDNFVESRKRPVPEDLSDLRYQIALANRLLTNEGVLDAFGHVSMRHPTDPGRYLLSRSRSPGVIEAGDIFGVHPRFRTGRAADRPALCRARDPRLHLSGASRCDGGVPSPRARGDAVLHRRRAHRSRVPPRRGRRRDRAVLEPERRVRRHQPLGGEAGGGPLACARHRDRTPRC